MFSVILHRPEPGFEPASKPGYQSIGQHDSETAAGAGPEALWGGRCQ